MPNQRSILLPGLLCVLLVACQRSDTITGQPASDTETPAEPDAGPGKSEIEYPGGALFRHMHLHAAQLEGLNAALDDGDLIAAGTPAYWLSRHEMLDYLPESWRPYVVNMRLAARSVEEATDLASARAATERIADNCRGCHEAAGR